MSIEVQTIRKDFPVLMNNPELVYLDSTATSLKPQVVIDAERKYYEEVGATVHRGVYDLSQKATDMYEGARETVRKFINAKSAKEIVFTRNATEAINLVSNTIVQMWGKWEPILTTEMEHHSNIVPWLSLKQWPAHQSRGSGAGLKGADVRYIPLKEDGQLDLSKLDELLTGVKLLTLTHMSNVLGTVNDVKMIIQAAHKVGAVVLVDAAQSVPHMPVDVQDLDADFLVFSGHKMLGPTGIGVLYGKAEILKDLPPFLKGGDMVLEVTKDGATWNELPWKFEAGTPNIAGTIGLGAAIEYLQKLGMENMWAHEQELMRYGLAQLMKIEGVAMLGGALPPPPTPPRAGGGRTTMLFGRAAADNNFPPVSRGTKGGLATGGRGAIFSFTIDGVHPHDIGSIMNSQNIAIRAGHHCAMPLHQKFGIPASARASCYLYNTKEEIDALVAGIKKVKEMFV